MGFTSEFCVNSQHSTQVTFGNIHCLPQLEHGVFQVQGQDRGLPGQLYLNNDKYFVDEGLRVVANIHPSDCTLS